MNEVRILVLLFILIPVKTFATESIATEAFFKDMASSAKRRCGGASLLRQCFSVNEETCVNRVNSRLDGCLRDQRIKILGQPTLSKLAAAGIEREVGACVNREYYNLGQSSFKQRNGCFAMLPKAAGSAPANRQPVTHDERRIAAYEDPLEDQRRIRDRFEMHWRQDVALLRTWKEDIKSRKACPGYSGKSSSSCFKFALARLKISSAGQIVSLLAIGTYAGLMDRDAKVPNAVESSIDNILSVFELAQTEGFHLKVWQPKTDADLNDLEILRKQEAELIKLALARAEKSIGDLLESHPRAARAPAGSGMDARSRLEFQKKRDWSF